MKIFQQILVVVLILNYLECSVINTNFDGTLNSNILKQWNLIINGSLELSEQSISQIESNTFASLDKPLEELKSNFYLCLFLKFLLDGLRH